MTLQRTRNIQVIDGADNCVFSIFSADEGAFKTIFPEDGQDIEYAEDFVERVGEVEANRILTDIWAHPVHKPSVAGLHGTLFFGLSERKAHFPSKRECDTNSVYINPAQRALYESIKSGGC